MDSLPAAALSFGHQVRSVNTDRMDAPSGGKVKKPLRRSTHEDSGVDEDAGVSSFTTAGLHKHNSPDRPQRHSRLANRLKFWKNLSSAAYSKSSDNNFETPWPNNDDPVVEMDNEPDIELFRREPLVERQAVMKLGADSSLCATERCQSASLSSSESDFKNVNRRPNDSHQLNSGDSASSSVSAPGPDEPSVSRNRRFRRENERQENLTKVFASTAKSPASKSDRSTILEGKRFLPPVSSNGPHISLEKTRQLEMEEFYSNYEVADGAVTAVVLGGFFSFVCLLVVYKTKCKSLWRNRRNRLTNTPATVASMNGPPGIDGRLRFVDGTSEDGSSCNDCYWDGERCLDGFEFVPLQTVCNDTVRDDDDEEDDDDDDDEDMYFLDEVGNFVFPVASPPMREALCLCLHSPDGSNLYPSRRISQISGISNAFTVKSLPGAYLYIPMIDSSLNSITSFSCAKRSLSDPEIRFPPHRIILTINPSSEQNENVETLRKTSTSSTVKRTKLQQRSLSVQQAAIPGRDVYLHSQNHKMLQFKNGAVGLEPCAEIAPSPIDVLVTQPTPNASPSSSSRNISGESRNRDSYVDAIEEQFAMQISTTFREYATSLTEEGKPSVRRVSFGEDGAAADNGAKCDEFCEVRRGKGSLVTSSRQMTVPLATNTNMSYLQVPGQQQLITQTVIAPPLSPEATRAQTSIQARRRRASRLMKLGSFCSINSEEDGDFFGPTGQPKSSHVLPSATLNKCGESTGSNSTSSTARKLSDALSEYSEFVWDDCRSDISELFGGTSPNKCPTSSTGNVTPGERGSATNVDDAVGTSSSKGGLRNPSPSSIFAVNDESDGQKSKSENSKLDAGERLESFFTSDVKVYTEDELYESSSCSISVESDGEPCHQLVIVPVTIEPRPPELRSREPLPPLHRRQANASSSLKPQTSDEETAFMPGAGCPPPSIAHSCASFSSISPANRFSKEEPEEKSGMNPHRTPIRFQPEALESTLVKGGENSELDVHNEVNLEVEPSRGMSIVLVRDVGIQVRGDSPNLNLHRQLLIERFKQPQRMAATTPCGNNRAATAPAQPSHIITSSDGRNEDDERLGAQSFPAEILF